MNHNLILMTDGYKVTHHEQYPQNTTSVYSYLEARGGRWDEVVFFGLQYFLQKHLSKRVILADVIEAEEMLGQYFGDSSFFFKQGWERIATEFDGRLPIRIKAVPEGTVVPVSNVLVTVENTHPDFAWLTNYIETLLSQVWYPCTVATLSREIKKMFRQALTHTGSPDFAGLPFQLHDFGCRGVSSSESAAIGGLAHLTSFMGTDTLPALTCGAEYYGEPCAGFSVPAAEHSTVTLYGRDGEAKAFERMVDLYSNSNSPAYSVVSDSYDLIKAVTHLICNGPLKQKILAGRSTFVVRPDSGDPKVILPQVLNLLWQNFGGNRTDTGHKVINPKVRVIQGDGIKYETLPAIIKAVTDAGFAFENMVFGSGGGLLQSVDRDTLSFAFKASHAVVDGQGRDVYKEPVTGQFKKSKRGRLKLIENSNGFSTVSDVESHYDDILQTVYENGECANQCTLTEVRSRVEKG